MSSPARPTPLRDEMDQSVAHLVRSVAEGRASLVRPGCPEVQALSEAFVGQLQGVLRLARVSGVSEAALGKELRELSASLARLHEVVGSVRLQVVEGRVYVSRRRLALHRSPHIARGLQRDLGRHGAGGLIIDGALSPSDCGRLALVLALRQPPGADALGELVRSLESAGLRGVRPLPELREEVSRSMEDAVLGPRERLGRAAEDCYAGLLRSQLPDFTGLRRHLAAVAIELERDPPAPLQRLPASPFAAHCLRVTELALLLGQALGLGGDEVQELGVVALLHDTDALLGAEDGPEQGRERLSRLFLRQRGFHPSRVRRLRALLDQHGDYSDPRGPPSLQGRMLRLLDDYDNLVRTGGAGLSPASALEVLAAGAGGRYDPALVRLLVSVLGKYPPGTLLELDDGRMLRVLGRCRGPETFDKPICELVRLPDSSVPRQASTVDLALDGVVARVVQPV